MKKLKLKILTLFVSASAISFSALGCGDAESRVKTSAVNDSKDPFKFPVEVPPLQSEPMAVETVKKIVAAHTSNNPALLEKLKGVSFIREGNVAGKAIKVEMSGTWPDRGRYTWSGNAPVPITFRILDQSAFQDVPQGAAIDPLTEKRHEDLFRDMYADWLQTLVPLTEDGAILANGPEFKLGEQSFPSVRLWRPGKPQAILYYDPKSFLLTRIAYDGRFIGEPAFFELALSEHKAFDGFFFATKIYVRNNGQDSLQFDKATYEIGKQHDIKLFGQP